MSYLVFHLSKYKSSNIVGLQRHNQRENKNYSNQDIDTSMSSLNYDLVNSKKISFTKKVKEIIDTKRTSKRAIRKDAVTYSECIISSDNDFFRKLDIKEQQRFFEVSLKFLENRIGKDNIISANVGVASGKCGFHTLRAFSPLIPRVCRIFRYSKVYIVL